MNSALTNPYNLGPAGAAEFIGRSDILARWEERLLPGSEAWKNGQSWILIGPGGTGKTSLLRRMEQFGKEEFYAQSLFIDLGLSRDTDNPEELFNLIDGNLPSSDGLGQRMRQWYGLGSEATLETVEELIADSMAEQGLALPGEDWHMDLEEGEPGQVLQEGIVCRLVQLFNSIAVLSEDPDFPVMVFIDHSSKLYQSECWVFIAQQLLALIERVRNSNTQNLVFVLALRPEQKGELEYNLKHPGLFTNLHSEYLQPFSYEEAVQALVVRDQDARRITHPLASLIAKTIEAPGGIDPYTAQLSAMVVWFHLAQQCEEQDAPAEPNSVYVLALVRDAHASIIALFRKHTLQWKVLKLLAYQPGGLSALEITLRLKGEGVTQADVDSTLEMLVNHQGYPVIRKIILPVGEARYTILHDLLRAYIVQQTPKSDRLIEQARRTLEEGVWRYYAHSLLLGEDTLHSIWEYRRELEISPRAWKAIVYSCLQSQKACSVPWLEGYPDIFVALLNSDMHPDMDETTLARTHLVLAVLSREIEPASKALEILARYSKSPINRLKAAEALARTGEWKVSQSTLSELAYHSKDEQVCLESGRALGQLGDADNALKALAQLAQDSEDNTVRMEAIRALGHLGKIASPVLFHLARSSEYEPVCLEAVKAMAHLGEVALQGLSELASTGEYESVRLEATGALAHLGKSAFPILFELARTSEYDSVRMEVAKALVHLGDQEVSLSVLSELVHKDKDFLTRLEATKALARLGADSLLIDLALNDEDLSVRLEAAKALANQGERKSSLQVLAELARGGKFETVRLEAAKVLAHLGDQEVALGVLTELARSSRSRMVRWEVTRALAHLGDRDAALPVLSELANNSRDKHVRLEAAKALARRDREVALPVLQKLGRTSRDERVRLEAAVTLAQVGERDVSLPVLARLAHISKDDRIRLEATKALAGLGRVAWPVLAELAQKSLDRTVLLEAGQALAGMGDMDRALPVLSKLTGKDEDLLVRLEAAGALVRLGETSLPVLFELARAGEHDWVRLEAARALARMGDRDVALPVLSELARAGENAWMRMEAASVLAQLDALPVLLKISWDSPLEEGAEAALALAQVTASVQGFRDRTNLGD